MTMWNRLRQFVCSLGGHHATFRIDPDGIRMACSHCQYVWPGWIVE